MKVSKYFLVLYLFLITVSTVIYLFPMFIKFDRFLYHDWDQHLFYHGALVSSVKEYFQMPFWNPWYCHGGHILFANPQTRLLTPFFLLHLVMGEFSALKLEIFFHYIIGLLGMMLISKNIYRITNPLYYFLPSVIFLFSSYSIAHFSVGHTNFLCLTYIPFVFYYFRKAIIEGIPRFEIYSAFFMALMIFEGGVYIFPYTIFFLGIYSLLNFIKKKSSLYLYKFFKVAIFSFLFSSIKLIPALFFINGNPRLLHGVEGLSPHILPDMFFTPFTSRLSFPEGLWWDWHEYTAYIGIPLFLMLCISIVYCIYHLREKTNYFIYIVILIFFLSLSLGTNEYGIYNILKKIPVFSQLRVPARFSIMALFSMSLLMIPFMKILSEKRNIKIHITVLIFSMIVFFDLSNNSWKILDHAIWERYDIFKAVLEKDNSREFRQIEKHPPYTSSMYMAVKSNAYTDVCYEPLNIKKRPLDIFLKHDLVYAGKKSSTISNIRFSPNRITFDAVINEKDRIILNQNFEEGWRISDPSMRISQETSANAIEIAPGRYEGLSFFYRPVGFISGCMLTLMGIVLAFLYCRRSHRKKSF